MCQFRRHELQACASGGRHELQAHASGAPIPEAQAASLHGGHELQACASGEKHELQARTNGEI